MRPFPEKLRSGPFTREQALAAGVTPAMLRGARLVRIHEAVYRHRDHVMTWEDSVSAARMALPRSARLTHISRIQELGLDLGPRRPLHFVVEGDLHLALRDVILHRTKRLAPHDDSGVSPTAAFIAYCSTARLIDAIKVGDWLLAHDHMTPASLTALALTDRWRDGADEALLVSEWLDGRSRSVKESELRAVLRAAGLPRPSPNHRLPLGEDALAFGDLVFVEQGLVVEFEGSHHQTDREQYVSDIERYALMRAHRVPYLQVTHEQLSRARTLVGTVFRALVDHGYAGPPPSFDEEWTALFTVVRHLLPSRRERLRAIASGE